MGLNCFKTSLMHQEDFCSFLRLNPLFLDIINFILTYVRKWFLKSRRNIRMKYILIKNSGFKPINRSYVKKNMPEQSLRQYLPNSTSSFYVPRYIFVVPKNVYGVLDFADSRSLKVERPTNSQIRNAEIGTVIKHCKIPYQNFCF